MATGFQVLCEFLGKWRQGGTVSAIIGDEGPDEGCAVGAMGASFSKELGLPGRAREGLLELGPGGVWRAEQRGETAGLLGSWRKWCSVAV